MLRERRISGCSWPIGAASSSSSTSSSFAAVRDGAGVGARERFAPL
jgi:hypothetical protein